MNYRGFVAAFDQSKDGAWHGVVFDDVGQRTAFAFGHTLSVAEKSMRSSIDEMLEAPPGSLIFDRPKDMHQLVSSGVKAGLLNHLKMAGRLHD